MEAYFHNDLRIEEWVDQITEKIFAVSLLTGGDSEAEFQKGCQIVTKLTSLLMGISTFPAEYLEDGVRQLVEQQLPDQRVIDNFPSFQEIMTKMIREGMLKAVNVQNDVAILNGLNLQEETHEFIKIIDSEVNLEYNSKVARELNEEKADWFIDVANEEIVTESVVPALANVKISCYDLKDSSHTSSENSLQLAGTFNNSVKEDPQETIIEPEPYVIPSAVQVPEDVNWLEHVLKTIFPNSVICWNLEIMDQVFLAQVEDILIDLIDHQHFCSEENFKKEGWKVFKCSSEDLAFPRRLERGIREFRRSGKNSIIV